MENVKEQLSNIRDYKSAKAGSFLMFLLFLSVGCGKKEVGLFPNEIRDELILVEVYKENIISERFHVIKVDSSLGEINLYSHGNFAHGQVFVYYDNENIAAIFNYNNGMSEGVQQVFTREGLLESIYYYDLDEKKETSTVLRDESYFYYDNNQLAEIQRYKFGLKQGSWPSYNQTGTLISLKVYDDDELIKEEVY